MAFARSKTDGRQETHLRGKTSEKRSFGPLFTSTRRHDEQEEQVRPRSEEVWKLDWQRVGAHVTDSSQPISDVVSDIFGVAWKGL